MHTIQGPAWTLADMETGECENIEKTKFKEEWEEIPSPYPCQKPDRTFTGDDEPMAHQGYCLVL